MIRNTYRIISTPIGWIGLLWSDLGLKRCTLPCSKSTEALYNLRIDGSCNESSDHDPRLITISKHLSDYFLGLNPNFQDSLDLIGTEFQQSLWLVTSSIPYGTTRSYSWVARQIGKPKSYRAVGQALKANPIPIFIPCHRVISSSNGLGGYAGTSGLDIKEQLLKLEGYM